MSAIHALEVRITRDLIRRRERRASQPVVEQVITVLALVACFGALLLFLPGLFWLLALAAFVLCLGS